MNQGARQINIKTKFITLAEDSSASIWIMFRRTNLAGNGTTNFSAVLTPAQSSVLVKAAESGPGVDLLREASVTTLSGRETEIQEVDLKSVVTYLNPQALTRPGISSKANGTNGLYQTAGTAMHDESPSATPVPGLKKKRLLVLVTPTIIDPAGNPLR